jgi:putative solute:sodium symporter small subunit
MSNRPTSPQLSPRQRAYWRATRRLTASLLTVWFMVSFVTAYFAIPLNRIEFFGFPLGFYIFAQGALIVYLATIAIYVWAMGRLDRRYGVAERR